MSKSKLYNTTDLTPSGAFERHVYHRDQFAHFLRWSYVLHLATIGMKVLDVGCGQGSLYEVFYRNRFSPAKYLGLDIREKTIEANKLKFPKAEFQAQDLTKPYDVGNNWDIVASFEVLEHVGKQNIDAFLINIVNACNKNTVVLLSTPCYDPKVGAADNHTYDSGDGRGKQPQEFTYDELKNHLEKYFVIEANYGTFASQKDYKHLLTLGQKEVFDQLHSYYDSNLVSNIFAPLFPEHSRNVIWRCRLK